MRWFYVVSIALAIALGLAPFCCIQPQDTSMLHGSITVPPERGARTGVTREVSVMYDTYSDKIKSLDPATWGDAASATLQACFYETLYTYHYLKRPSGPDDPDVIIPQLADGMPEISPDGLTWTIRLKKGIFYHRNACFGMEEEGKRQEAGGKRLRKEVDSRSLLPPASCLLPSYKTREVIADDFVLAFKRVADYHITTELALAYIHDKLVGIDDYREKTRLYPKGRFSRYFKEDLKGVQAVDRYTIRLKLTKPFPESKLLQILAMNNYAPVPREALDYWLSTTEGEVGRRVPLPESSRSPEIHDFRATVGTGAYYLHDFVDGGRIVLCRNPDFRPEYYPTEGEPGDREAGLLQDAGKRVPFVDVIYWDYAPEPNAMWMLFMTRQSDTAWIPMQQYRQVITPSKELDDRMSREGIRLLKYVSPSLNYLTFNMQDPVLGKSQSLRQAMNLAVNVPEYIRVLHNGRGVRATNFVPRGFEGHAGAGLYFHYDTKQALAKLDQARRELIAAGAIKSDEPIPALTMDIGGTDEEQRRVGEFFQGEFQRVGLKLNVELEDWPTLLAKIDRKQCQMYISTWGADYRDSENFLQLFYTPNIKSGTNNSGYSNARFDTLYEQLADMPRSRERTGLVAQALGIISEDCPVLLLSESIDFVLVQPWVGNFKPHPFAYGFAKYRRIDDAARKKAGGR